MKIGNYRLGLDLGANSLGWAILALDDSGNPTGIVKMGVRIFSDGRNPKDGQSLAVMRRGPRQMRRRRDRYLKRRGRLLQALIEAGLMPKSEADRKNLQKLNPYLLRAKGVEGELTPFELGRALFHLNQRRGFKSNRKTDAVDGDEKGKIASAVAEVKKVLEEGGYKTLGQYLYARQQDGKTVRARLNGEGAKATYELYLQRDMIASEFDSLWEAQSRYHAELLTEDKRTLLRDIILFQRKLKPVPVGRCSLDPSDTRLPLAHPISQQLRIYQELNHLRITEPGQSSRSLTLAERDLLAEKLMCQKQLAFSSIKKTLKLPNSTVNLESEKREKLQGDIVSCQLSHKELLGDEWFSLEFEDQCSLVELLLEEEDERVVIEELAKRWGIDLDVGSRLAKLNLKPDGYGRIGKRAGLKVLHELKKDVVTYDKACNAAGYKHSDSYDGVIYEDLPYYGQLLIRHVGFGTGNPGDSDEVRYGKIANPTVHIGLNQLRKLVNAIIKRYGHPNQIAIELARSLKVSPDKRQEIEREQAKNQKKNEIYKEEIESAGFKVTGDSLLRMRLWHELSPNPLERRCVYTGELISIHKLLGGDGSFHVDHILPFSRTLDDSFTNKILCSRRANSTKKEQGPYEAFAHSPQGFDWEAILARAQVLPINKRKRFSADAMERFDGENDFLSRHLHDTAYLSRVAKQYLSAVCPPNDIYSNPGRLTALLRGKWGLNRLLSDRNLKNRCDHRHHAIDALVIGLSDRRLLQRVATASARARHDHVDRLLEDMPEPWTYFHGSVEQAVNSVVVSFKPDHGPEGALHNDTAYGIVSTNDKGLSVVRHRKPLDSITKLDDVEKIVDARLREAIRSAISDCKDTKSIKERLHEFTEQYGTRRIRVEEVLRVIPVKGQDGKEYKAFKGDGNYCYEIFETPAGRWDGEIINTFTANQKDYKAFMGSQRFRNESFSGKPLVMRICRDDIVAINNNDDRRLMRVTMLSDGIITLSENHEGGNLRERDRNKEDVFKYMYKSPSKLKELNARRVFVDVLGRVKDPQGARNVREAGGNS